MTKFAPDNALKLIASGKLTFDERVVPVSPGSGKRGLRSQEILSLPGDSPLPSRAPHPEAPFKAPRGGE